MNKQKTVLLLLLCFMAVGNMGFAQDLEFFWAQQYGSNNNANDLKSLASDNTNKVFSFCEFEGDFDIDGETHTSQGGKDLMFYAINEYGGVEWIVTEGGIDNEFAEQIQCDQEGNVYIIGKFNNTMVMNNVTYQSNGTFDMFVAKYSNDGEFLWCKTFGGPKSEALVSIEIKYNRIILAGRFYEYTVIEEDTLFSESGTDIFIAKFDLDGNLLNTLTAGGNSVDMVSDMTVDVYGNIYITGDFYSDITFSEDYYFDAGDLLGVYIAKYDPSLNLIWAYQVNGDDLKPGVKIDVAPDGSCSISGVFTSSVQFANTHLNTADFDEDIYMANFSPDGQVNWAHRFYSNSMESVVGLQVDKLGDIYVSGLYLAAIHFDDLTLPYSLC